MSTPETAPPSITAPLMVSPAAFLTHWQGHRRLTRRVIEAFPAEQLFTFTAAPPMRPFGEMCGEMLLVGEMTLDGMTTGRWTEPDWSAAPQGRTDLLNRWDVLTRRMDTEFPSVDPGAFTRTHTLPWGDMTGWEATIYQIDNEIHHRGQGYVYLRALGTQPPAFYER